MPQPPLPALYFRGGGTTTTPHHYTRYIYPSLIGPYPISSLVVQPPVDCHARYRPKGDSNYDTTHATITNKRKPCPTRRQFASWIVAERAKDHEAGNPIGRAMRRVSGFEGNTVLEMGKFRGEGGFVLVIRRESLIALEGGGSGLDEDVYEFPAGRWKGLVVPAEPGHDSWWRRLDDLLTGATDRACVAARDQACLVLGRGMPFFGWAEREDVRPFETGIEVADIEVGCMICGDEFLGVEGGERPMQMVGCELPHFMCVVCLEITLEKEETMKGNHFKCPVCPVEQRVLTPRKGIVLPYEQKYWAWRAMDRELWENEHDFAVYARETPDGEIWRSETRLTVDARKVPAYMSEVLVYVASVQPYGHLLDNPITFRETELLHSVLLQNLPILHGKSMTLKEAQMIIQKIAEKAVTVVRRDDGALKNPEFPPNYLRWRDIIVERLGHACFLKQERMMALMDMARRHRQTQSNG